MWTADSKDLTFEKAEAAADKAKKNLKIGPFEVIRKVFETTEETRKMSLIDKSDLFFHDYRLEALCWDIVIIFLTTSNSAFIYIATGQMLS